jgi:hypothetical protein
MPFYNSLQTHTIYLFVYVQMVVYCTICPNMLCFYLATFQDSYLLFSYAKLLYTWVIQNFHTVRYKLYDLNSAY